MELNKMELNNFLEKRQSISEIWAVYNDHSLETRLESEKTGNEKLAVFENENGEKIVQEINSAKTSRKQIPKSLKAIAKIENELKSINKDKNIIVFDVGCGADNDQFKSSLNKLGFEYYGCDLYNQNKEYNLDSIRKCENGKADIVCNNNVLNAISEKEIRNVILNQCKNALNTETGVAIFSIYEGEYNSIEKEKIKAGEKIELSPIKTSNGWQNRMKTKEYISEFKEVFPNVVLTKIAGTPLIIASENDKIDLTKVLNIKNDLIVKNKTMLKR